MLASQRQIKLAALISYATIFINIVVGIFYTPWLIKSIGKSDYGIYVLITAFLSYFLMDFGIGEALARFAAKYRVEKNEEKIKDLLGLATTLYLIIDLVILLSLVIVYFFIPNIFKQLTPSEIETFKLVYIIAGLFSLISFPFTSLNGLLLAYNHFITIKAAEFFTKIGVIFFMVIAIFMGYGIFALVMINAMVGVAVIIMKLISLRKQLKFNFKISLQNRELLKEIFSLSIWATLMGVAQRLLINAAPTILGILSGTHQIAIFSIGMIIEGYTWTFANALNGFFLTKVSQLHANNDKLGIDNLMVKLGRIQLFLSGLLILGIVVFGKDFINLWMGNSFNDSYYVMLLLIVPGIIILTQEIALTQMYVRNDLKPRAILFIIAAVICIIISVILSPKIGAIGSALGVFFALIFCHVIGMNFIYWKKFDLDIPRFFREVHFKFIPIAVIFILIGFLVNYFIPEVTWLKFGIKVITLSLVYLFTSWVLFLNKEEKNLVLTSIYRK